MKKKLVTLLFSFILAALIVVLCIYTYLGSRPSYAGQPETLLSHIVTGTTVLLAVAIISFLLFAARRFYGKR